MISVFFNFRPAFCVYKDLGCTWDGMWHQKEAHENGCNYPMKSGKDLLDSVATAVAETKEKNNYLSGIVKMFSYEKIAICGIYLSCSDEINF